MIWEVDGLDPTNAMYLLREALLKWRERAEAGSLQDWRLAADHAAEDRALNEAEECLEAAGFEFPCKRRRKELEAPLREKLESRGRLDPGGGGTYGP